MEPCAEFDQIHIISDLHLGGVPGRQIFGSAPELNWLIRHLADATPEKRIGLIINGDFIDFLAEVPAKHFDPQGAVAKMERVALSDSNFSPVFTSLRYFLSKPGRKLIINLGNHDLELALPWVRQRLIRILTNDDAAASARLSLVFDGSGVFVKVGTSSVLCVHGNEVDEWNPADFEKLRQIGRDYQFGRPVEPWIPNAGSKMVIDVMNQVKINYPFVDLLKPETEGAVPILVACDPSQVGKLDNVLGLAGAVGSFFQSALFKPRGMLGEDGSIPADTDAAGNAGLTQALLNRTFNPAANLAPASASAIASSMMLEAEQQVMRGDNPLKLVQGQQATQLGVFDALRDLISNKPAWEVLRQALETLDQDHSFDLKKQDPTFTRLDREVKANIDFLVAGHTHLERAIKRQSGGYYFNSGTWARLIRIKASTRQDPEAFKKLFDVLKNGNMETLDAEPGLIFKLCTVVTIEKDEDGVLGELRHIQTKDGVTTFDAVANTQFRRK